MAGNEVRIIGGMWKGRKLVFPKAAGLRPTLGRARETLFNWVAADIVDARCLDLYAGSGALGCEALSRGAREVDFVERSRTVAAAITRNLAQLGDTRGRVWPMSAKKFLRRTKSSWDIIFIDPPFNTHDLTGALELINEASLLAPGGVIYFELPRRATVTDLSVWRAVRHSRAGDTQFGLLEPAGAANLSP